MIAPLDGREATRSLLATCAVPILLDRDLPQSGRGIRAARGPTAGARTHGGGACREVPGPAPDARWGDAERRGSRWGAPEFAQPLEKRGRAAPRGGDGARTPTPTTCRDQRLHRVRRWLLALSERVAALAEDVEVLSQVRPYPSCRQSSECRDRRRPRWGGVDGPDEGRFASVSPRGPVSVRDLTHERSTYHRRRPCVLVERRGLRGLGDDAP
jgi:hypothetical protein